MTYRMDLTSAAKRHLSAGKKLHAEMQPGLRPGSCAVAGYLYGMAGELALKQIMRQENFRPLADDQRRDDPFYAHFPMLVTLLRDQITSRAQQRLARCIAESALFQGWSTNMRYAPTSDIEERLVEKWRGQAERLLAQMEAI